MKKYYYLPALFICLMLIVLSGCKKNATSPATAVDESVQSSTDNAMIDGEFTSIFSYVDDQGDQVFTSSINKDKDPVPLGLAMDTLLPVCANPSYDSTTHTLTIDFGSTDCVCRDGLTRRGKIIAVFTGKYKQPGSSVTVTLQNYYVQDMNVFGTKTITYQSAFSWNVVVSNAGIVTPNGTASWNSNRVVTKTKGTLTPKIWIDDEYSITGTANGVNRNGVAYSVTIDEPLIKEMACFVKDFVSGVLTIINNKQDTLSINYDPLGTQACNKLATVTYNGITKTITLR